MCFCVMNLEFDVIFIELQHNIVYVSAIWPSVILVSLDENFLFVKSFTIKICFSHILVKKSILPKRRKKFKKKMRNCYKT